MNKYYIFRDLPNGALFVSTDVPKLKCVKLPDAHCDNGDVANAYCFDLDEYRIFEPN